MQKQIHDNSINHGRACSLSHGTWRRVGAKLACAGACALMAGQLLLPSVALAAEWVNVGGTQYNKAAGDDVGTWSWDGADDMKLNGYDGAGISAQGNLNIGVTGTNTVTADSLQSAIEVKDGNLAITGEGTLNATAEPQKSRSAVKVECGSLAISGDVTLNATAGTDAIAVSGDGKTGGDVDIRGANVNVTATNKVPHTIGIHTRAGNITINEGADVHVEAEANGGFGAVAVYAENISSEHGGCIAVDNAKLDAAARNGCSVSVALYSSGGKDTYLSVTNGADVTLVASDRADVLDGVWMRAGDGVSRVLVENSSLTVRCGDGTGHSRKHGYGIYSQSGSQSAIPRIDIINSNVEVSGNAAAIYAVNQGDAAPCLSIDGGSVVTTPAGGTVRETAGNGLVIGAAGSSTIQDVRTSDEVARSVVISSGDAVEPEPTPQPEPTPAPTPQPGGGSETGTPSVTLTQASSTAAASKPAAKAVAAQKSVGTLAATGDNAATAAAALGIAGATVAAAGIAATKHRKR